ncbi:MAG: HAD hydrolase-like protein [Desulfobacterales bacterium]|nr:HAD hydrolase-like protein [Desulfobacterales bacterium]
MKYELIVIDFDGTLADTYPWFASVINLVADKYQFKRIDDSKADTMRGYGALDIINHQ